MIGWLYIPLMLSGVETTLQAVSVVCAGFFEGAVEMRNISKSNLQRLAHTIDLYRVGEQVSSTPD